MLLRRILASSGMAALVLGGAVVTASPASAAVERCSVAKSIEQGVTMYSCMLVGLTEGRAYTKVYYNLTSYRTITVCDDMHRGSIFFIDPFCEDVVLGPGKSRIDTGGTYLTNPTGVQQWRSRSLAFPSNPNVQPVSVESPNVYDT